MSWPLILAGAGTAGAAYWSARYGWWLPTVDWRRPRVLMYHMVSPQKPGGRYRGMRVDPEAFERQLRWLRDAKFHFATMSELATGRTPERSVVLTFDDGYEDNHSAALPLLKQYGAKATLYLVAVRDDGADWSARKKAHHNSGELVREPKLSDSQVSEMVSSGVFELGAHTLGHANLSVLSPEQKREEIAGSRKFLEDRFGVPVQTFAYPFGIWDARDRDLVAEAGYTTAVTTDSGIDPLPLPDPFAVKRVKISGKENHLAFRLRVRCGRRGLWK
jgi:peptidoglycan/xylan/chitin deacetylase (PgdA/CDA1 family)